MSGSKPSKVLLPLLGFILAVLIAVLLKIGYSSSHAFVAKPGDVIDTNKWIDIAIGLICGFIPLVFITLFISPITNFFKKVEASEEQLEREFSPLEKEYLTNILIKEVIERIDIEKINLKTDLEGLFLSINNVKNELDTLTKEVKRQQHSEAVYRVFNSYHKTDWKFLLQDALTIHYSLLYLSETWKSDFKRYFEYFCEKGGKLELYLPNPFVISNFFFNDAQIREHRIRQVISSYLILKKLKETYPDNVNINILNEGFNYALAHITKVDGSVLYMMSPYQNNTTADAPVVVFNSHSSNEDLIHFFDCEKKYLQNSKKFPHYIEEKYIVWRSNEQVFISTGLQCPAGCKFCYINSLVEERASYDPIEIAATICRIVTCDPRFKVGKKGTKIMLGGFTDPFLDEHYLASKYIIDHFASQNFVHVATRFLMNNKRDLKLDKGLNLVINYSISSLRKDGTELNNQINRLADAKKSIELGFKVALYIRPIIQGVTLTDIDDIIALALEAGIEVITIGGLYVDQRIINELRKVNIDVPIDNILDKQFVLDHAKVLSKIGCNDYEEILNKLKSYPQFIVFESSKDRVKYFSENF